MIYNDKKDTYKELLDKHKTASKHTRNLQILVTETFKAKIGGLTDLIEFKTKIKIWVAQNCQWRLRKAYIQIVGFI